ncbi:MAG: efflux RND transporter periplasmic adaptor subunit [Chloroflexi bacterium]|nr:efflux RND transporter periplasmic adaptor subunit [Chloroflexota bacterium]
MKRNVLIIAVVIVVVVIAAVFFGIQQMNAKAATATKVQTATAQLGTLVATVAEAGNITAPNTASLAFSSSGTVKAVEAQVGQQVKQGQVLMELDTTDLQTALKTAQSGLVSAQASLDSAKLKQAQVPQQLVVAKEALDNAGVTLNQAQLAYNAIAWRNDVAMTSQASTLQTATIAYQTALANYQIAAEGITDTTTVTTAQAAVDSAQVAVTQAQDNLDKAKLVAPFDGSVAAVNFAVGDTASGTAVVVADLNHLQVNATVAEVDIPNIKVGQAAQITLDAVSNKTYDGKVAAIGPVGTVTSGVVNYPVTVDVTNPDDQIKPGMTANLSVIINQRDNVLLVPLRAVRTQGNQKLVTVLFKGQQIDTPVQVGLTNDTSVEITQGLKAGDQVVLGQTTTRTTGGGGPGFGGIGGVFRGD